MLLLSGLLRAPINLCRQALLWLQNDTGGSDTPFRKAS